MNYKEAFDILSTYIDVSVNTSMSDETRTNAHHCAYWFKQVISYGPNDKSTSRYIQRITDCEVASRYGMIRFLSENNYIHSLPTM
jgi:hypothetical protein